MTEKQIKLAVSSLLHDIGKVVSPGMESARCSECGYLYAMNELHISDESILNGIRYHHRDTLEQCRIANTDTAYITCFADEVAAAVDRQDGQDDDVFDKKIQLKSIFNILNGNNGNLSYAGMIIDANTGIPFPQEEGKNAIEFYHNVKNGIARYAGKMTMDLEGVNGLLAVLEDHLSYVPCSSSRKEQMDISLYDHVKITAAAALCVEQYLEEHGISDYRNKLFDQLETTRDEKMFLLYSMDVSGIQNFIYTISSKGALRGLRSRSFYLEIVMEHIVDELLDRVGLCRTNLIYNGGGHAYLLLPNTEKTKTIAEDFEKEVNSWFLKEFGISLYVGGGYAECSAKDLKNEPAGSYTDLYMTVSKMISKKKSHRYCTKEILYLNRKSHKGDRECEICHRMEQIEDSTKKCNLCNALERISQAILYKSEFVVTTDAGIGELPLPCGKYLTASEHSKAEMKKAGTFVRSYIKRDGYTGTELSTRLWIGDYTTGDSFEEFAKKSEGIERLGVLRADVDNLGTAFVHGFKRPDGNERYSTLSRTASLSRQLSMFFKGYINVLLKDGHSSTLSSSGARNVTIVYSGGDDVFLVGSWNEVVDTFIDLKKALDRFTENTLTISGGIGLYDSGYPINIMAREVAELEDASKEYPGKNALTLFDETGTYGWDKFTELVIGEKYKALENFFSVANERGNAFLYHILELLRNDEEKINTARYVYLLSRMEPDNTSPSEQKKAYREFANKMYHWRTNLDDRRELITAIYLYVYNHRTEEVLS